MAKYIELSADETISTSEIIGKNVVLPVVVESVTEEGKEDACDGSD